MINDDPSRLPTSVAGLFDAAFTLYARRFRLYLALALIAIAVQFLLGVLLPHTDGLVAGLEIIVDAFLLAAVSIGVAVDLKHAEADWSTILLAASERWGAVAIVAFALFIVEVSLGRSVFGSLEETGYLLFVLPIVTFWGAVALGQVVAAVEPSKNSLLLPLVALGKGMAIGFRSVNLGRLVLLSIVLVLPNVLDNILYDQLTRHGWHDVLFWANVPVDALSAGPLQALSTVFYVDFLRRAR